MGKRLFGGLFDFNRDGKLSSSEKAVEFHVFEEIMKEDELDEVEEDETDDVDENEELETELELNGLDADELSWMDEDERRETLEDAGLDPDDFDF